MSETGRIPRLHERWSRLRDAWRLAQRRFPGRTALVLAACAVVAGLSVAGPLWYLRSLRADLPTKAAIARIGEMDQATAVYDGKNHLAFTIFKEQRIDTPLAFEVPFLTPRLWKQPCIENLLRSDLDRLRQ